MRGLRHYVFCLELRRAAVQFRDSKRRPWSPRRRTARVVISCPEVKQYLSLVHRAPIHAGPRVNGSSGVNQIRVIEAEELQVALEAARRDAPQVDPSGI